MGVDDIALSIAIGGVDYTGMVRVGSLNVLDELNGPATAAFDLADRQSSATPAIGKPIIIKHGEYTLFAGQVDKFSKVRVKGTTMHDWHVQCVDYSCILGRRTYTGTIPAGTTLKAAVAAILTTALAGEGFTMAGVDTGPKLPKLQFQRLPVSDCLNEISRLTRYKWWVNDAKDIQFKDRSAEAAPWALTSLEQLTSYTYQRERSQYRNVQRILGTKVTASKATTVQWTADGKRRTFYLQQGTTTSGTAYDEIASVSLLTVPGADGLPMTELIGAPGTPTNKWEYSVGGNYISQVPDEATKPAGAVITLTYIGRIRIEGVYPSIDKWGTDAEIQERKSYEGGTGIYEAVEVDESIDDAGTAREKAKALRDLHGHIPTILEFDTFRSGLRAGQMLTVQLPNYPMERDQFLIDSVQIQDMAAVDEDFKLKYTVRCVASEVPKWQGYFAALLKAREAPKEEAWDEYQSAVYSPQDVLRVSDHIYIERRAYSAADVEKGALVADGGKSFPGNTILGAGTDSAAKLVELFFDITWPPSTIGFCEVS